MEPLFDKFIQFTPYLYSQNNPIRFIDENGNWPRDGQKFMTTPQDIKLTLSDIEERISSGYNKLFSGDFSGSMNQFIDNAKNSYEVFDLLPTNLMLDFVAPIEGISEGSKLLRMTKIEIAEEHIVPRELLTWPEEPWKAPSNKITGEKVEIHHIDQKTSGPFQEIFSNEHRGKGNFSKYHNLKTPLKREPNWQTLVKNYWKSVRQGLGF